MASPLRAAVTLVWAVVCGGELGGGICNIFFSRSRRILYVLHTML